MHPADMAERGLEHGDLIEIQTISANRALRLGGITVIEYDIARGSVAAYYPEANVLVPLDYIDEESGTPSYVDSGAHPAPGDSAGGLSRRAE